MKEHYHQRSLASIRSRFVDDPGMRKVVERFSKALSERSEQFDDAMSKADLKRLASMAHQLKGTAGGYGYDSIGLAAAALERETVAIEADLSSVRERVEDLILLCRAASSA